MGCTGLDPYGPGNAQNTIMLVFQNIVEAVRTHILHFPITLEFPPGPRFSHITPLRPMVPAARAKPYDPPATIDDLGVLDEIGDAMRNGGVGVIAGN